MLLQPSTMRPIRKLELYSELNPSRQFTDVKNHVFAYDVVATSEDVLPVPMRYSESIHTSFPSRRYDVAELFQSTFPKQLMRQ